MPKKAELKAVLLGAPWEPRKYKHLYDWISLCVRRIVVESLASHIVLDNDVL